MDHCEFEEVVEPIASEIETMEYYYLQTNKSLVSSVLKTLSSLYPIPEEHKHLKRVDRKKDDPTVLYVLICEKNEESEISTVASSLNLPLEEIYTAKVPRFPAFIKSHFIQGRALWPITYHPQTPPPSLTEGEINRYKELMKKAIVLGKASHERGNAPVGMVICDSEGEIVGESGDNRHTMFLDHCCFAGIRDRSNRLKEVLSTKRPTKEDPYLCTNCDVIMTREPCIMCCMCLLHSRVRRVIYGCDDLNGGFNHSIHIHYNNKLNHHFRVFRNVYEEECKALWNDSFHYV